FPQSQSALAPSTRARSIRGRESLEAQRIEVVQLRRVLEAIGTELSGEQPALRGPNQTPAVDVGPLPFRQIDPRLGAGVPELVLVEIAAAPGAADDRCIRALAELPVAARALLEARHLVSVFATALGHRPSVALQANVVDAGAFAAVALVPRVVRRADQARLVLEHLVARSSVDPVFARRQEQAAAVPAVALREQRQR